MKLRNVCLSILLVTVFLGFLSTGTVHAAAGVIPDLSLWAGPTWFKLTNISNAWHFSNVGVKPDPIMAHQESRHFLKCKSWDPINLILQCELFDKDDSGNWDPTPAWTFDLNYIAGNDKDFMCWFQAQTSNMIMGFTIRFVGTMNKEKTVLTEATVKTMGNYICEIDDVPGSTERWVGNIKIDGFMVPLLKVPVVLPR